MKGCDDPTGFDREACGRCTNCQSDSALIRQYETQHVATQIDCPQRQSAQMDCPQRQFAPIDCLLKQEVLNDVLRVIYEDLINRLTCQINSKYIDIDGIKADLKPIAENYLSAIKSRFDSSQPVIDEVTTKLAHDLVDQILPPEEEGANEIEAEDFQGLTPQLLDMMRD
jgi:hypothetical protein